jgi:histidinol dehydrogenase
MMKIIKYPSDSQWQEIIQRPYIEISAIKKTVAEILKKVKKKGDNAIFKYSKKFDGIKLKTLVVTNEERTLAVSFLNEELKKAILLAKNNIERFHATQREDIIKVETMPGITCWRRSHPIEKVGLYIPGASAPLFSTVLMLAIPATIAGCREIILCTPPGKDGHIHPAISYAADLCGITKIYKVGGAQAIAAMAYGTESIPKVFKIFGPGNLYVTAAKQLIQQEGIAIDMPAGPSEVLIIADDTSVPEFVAADLLSQAEHGADSQVILITTSELLAITVQEAINNQIEGLPRKEIAEKALQNSKAVVLNSLSEAIALSDLYAPEHLIISCSNAAEIADKVTNAGSVFIGNYSPESAGDYASGTNHTLPTNGYATMYSGVSLDSFVKKTTYQQLTKEGLANLGPAVMRMAEAEGLEAHKNAVAIRLKQLR